MPFSLVGEAQVNLFPDIFLAHVCIDEMSTVITVPSLILLQPECLSHLVMACLYLEPLLFPPRMIPLEELTVSLKRIPR